MSISVLSPTPLTSPTPFSWPSSSSSPPPLSPTTTTLTDHILSPSPTRTAPPSSTTLTDAPTYTDKWRPSPVYTFLATLVLLLSVSAAIVIRSFILRRRHRLMVEEAMRNGTWVPQEPGGRTPRRGVDLSKKPGMWDVYLGGTGGVGGVGGSGVGGVPGFHGESGSGYEKGYGGGTYGYGEEGREGREWGDIKPVSVAYVPRAKPEGDERVGAAGPLGLPVGVSDQNVAGAGAGGSGSMRGGGRASIFRRVAGYFRPARTTGGGEGESGAGAGAGGGAGEEGQREEERSGRVRVAVLIAMPRPPNGHGRRKGSGSSSEASGSGSGSGSGGGGSGIGGGGVVGPDEHPLSPTVAMGAFGGGQEEDVEETLPVLEVGVAEVEVLQGALDGVVGEGEAGSSLKGRDSVSVV
ncbi:hypothetical protein DFP72DRAFT_1173187 [Ephemerocybe angulata]|uniref:Uncharacterized protein n=1 Tax=Ephemerocybe angulata TaxID=980116 RepID=A0A8H6M2H4_9AGAR|nr:hypothetical protein DFP72DRAFT_1173187 [Tulosesus angulatus]